MAAVPTGEMTAVKVTGVPTCAGVPDVVRWSVVAAATTVKLPGMMATV